MMNEKELITNFLKANLCNIEEGKDYTSELLSQIIQDLETDNFKDKTLRLLEKKYYDKGRLTQEEYNLYKRLKNSSDRRNGRF